MISTRLVELVIDTVVCLTLAIRRSIASSGSGGLLTTASSCQADKTTARGHQTRQTRTHDWTWHQLPGRYPHRCILVGRNQVVQGVGYPPKGDTCGVEVHRVD